MFNYPPWLEPALALRGALDALLGAILLFGGIQLLRDRPSYRPAHVIYALLALIGLVTWLAVCIASRSFLVINSVICAMIVTLPYPFVALVFMFNSAGRTWHQRLLQQDLPGHPPAS